MQFYFTLWNHHRNARENVLDIAEPIIAGLRDLGHRVDIGNDRPRRNVINIVVENFHYKRVADQIRPYDFVIVATERIDGDGFNSERSQHWAKRWNNFPRVAREALAIWAIGDYTAEEYRRFAPAVQVTLGWSAVLEHRASSGPAAFDICAYGHLGTAARKQTIDVLRARLRVGTAELVSKAERDRLLSRSLFSYGFRPNADMACASISRIVSSLRLGIPVIQERVGRPSPLVDALEIVDGPDEIIERWDELRARREEILARQIDAWRAVPASAVMSEAIAAMRDRDRRLPRVVQQVFRSVFPNRGYT